MSLSLEFPWSCTIQVTATSHTGPPRTCNVAGETGELHLIFFSILIDVKLNLKKKNLSSGKYFSIKYGCDVGRIAFPCNCCIIEKNLVLL